VALIPSTDGIVLLAVNIVETQYQPGVRVGLLLEIVSVTTAVLVSR
jgi:hypothetical protein